MPLDSFSNNTDTLSDIIDRLDAKEVRNRVHVTFIPAYTDEQREQREDLAIWDEMEEYSDYVNNGRAEAEAIQEEMEAKSPRYGKRNGEYPRYLNRSKLEDATNSHWEKDADRSRRLAKSLRTQEKEASLNEPPKATPVDPIDLLHEWDTQFAEVTPEDLAAENRRNLDL